MFNFPDDTMTQKLWDDRRILVENVDEEQASRMVYQIEIIESVNTLFYNLGISIFTFNVSPSYSLISIQNFLRF